MQSQKKLARRPKQSGQEKRPRASGPRSRNGCVNCKVRHVKCDERKPRCNNCIKGGWKCDGPRSSTEESSPTAEKPPRPREAGYFVEWPPSQLPDGNSEDKRCFDYFRSHAAPILAGYFDSAFWSHLLLQISYAEQSVRHSLMAVSMLHEHYVLNPRRSSPLSQRNHTFSLRHYNTAIRYLSSQFTENQLSIEIVLVNCILFVCIELLLGGVHEAITHVHNGVKIINAWKESKVKNTPERTPANDHLIGDVLVPIFEHLNCQTLIYDSPSPVNPPDTDENKELSFDSFSNLYHARNALLVLTSMGIKLAKESPAYKDKRLPEPGSEDERDYTRTLSWHGKWKCAFEKLVTKLGNMSPEAQQGVMLLTIQYKVTNTWAQCCLKDETSFDAYMDEFKNIITLAEKLFENEKEQGGFSFETGTIPQLYVTIIKCRDPVLRRRALALLMNRPRREGFWDSRTVAKMAQKIIDIEEEGLESSDEFPKEEARVWDGRVLPIRAGDPEKEAPTQVFYRLRATIQGEIWRTRVENI